MPLCVRVRVFECVFVCTHVHVSVCSGLYLRVCMYVCTCIRVLVYVTYVV